MNGTAKSSRHEALRRFLKLQRQAAEITQHQLAERMGRYRSFVSAVETGQHRLTVVEFLDWADALDFDPCEAIRRVRDGKP
jgi:transcriptional regulator with XRE-family HTH domain